MPSRRAINKGPISLQSKSIRRICALSILRASESSAATTTTCYVVSSEKGVANVAYTQSFSTDIRFIMEHSFSTQAKTVASASKPILYPALERPNARA